MTRSSASFKRRAVMIVRNAAALVVLGVGLVGYVLAGGAAAYFALVALSHAVTHQIDLETRPERQ